jgi:hypothetical protein
VNLWQGGKAGHINSDLQDSLKSNYPKRLGRMW